MMYVWCNYIVSIRIVNLEITQPPHFYLFPESGLDGLPLRAPLSPLPLVSLCSPQTSIGSPFDRGLRIEGR